MKGKAKKFIALALVLSLVVGWNSLVNTTMAKYVTSWVASLNLGVLTDGSTIHGESVSNSTVQMTVGYADYGSVVGNAGHEEVGMGFGTGERYDTQVIGVGCRNVYRYTVSDKSGNAVDISDMNYLQFDIWLPKGYSSNPEVLYPNSTDAQRELANAELELGSGGTYDNYEIAFDLLNVLKIDTPTTKGDWYTVVVDLSQGTEHGKTGFDPKKLNFFGFYWSDESKTIDGYGTEYGYDRIGWSVIANMRFVKYATNPPGIHCQNLNTDGTYPDPTIRLGTVMEDDEPVPTGDYYYHLGNNLYQKVDSNADNANNFEDMGKDPSKIIVAGNDRDPHTTADNNKLSGRTAAVAVGGVADIPIDYINRAEFFYTIQGVSPMYKVKYGRDKMYGTHDDVITNTSQGSPLGTYTYWSSTSDGLQDENVGWNYLGGPINKMMLTTEYVLQYSGFDDEPYTNIYANAAIRAIHENLGAALNVSDNILLKNQTITNTTFHDNYGTVVKITPGTTADEANQLNGTSASNFWYVSDAQVIYGSYTPYYMETPPSTFSATFFPLSLQELTEAYGVGNYDEVRNERLAPVTLQYAITGKDDNDEDIHAPYYNSVGSDVGIIKDGFGDKQYTHGYFLRDPGDGESNACAVMAYNRSEQSGFHNFAGEVSAQVNIAWDPSGVRPACYVNLSLADNSYYNPGNQYYYLGSNVYREKTTGNLFTAGQDRDILTTADNNKLAGKATAAANIAVTVDPTTFDTCKITGISDDIYVVAGQDAMLGTYDDLICSKSGKLGSYWGSSKTEWTKLRWNFLSGTYIQDIRLMTEYVYHETAFRTYSSSLTDFYNGSLVDKFCNETFYSAMQNTMAPNILRLSTISVGYDSYVGNIDTGRPQIDIGGGNMVWPSWIDGIYYPTDDPSTLIDDTTGRQTQYNYSPTATLQRYFFAASLGDLGNSYANMTAVNTQSQHNDTWYRQYLAAPVAPYAEANGLTGTLSFSDTTTSLGYTNYKTAYYWLRNYGNRDDAGCVVTPAGFAMSRYNTNASDTWLSMADVGVRPCCALDLTKIQ